ncbi:MAG TPA: hypothetical protein IAA98_08015 [Candidatus Avipropionibacterium avicola]|uniref:Uncharacterized protein n=1 Tax=Candidatus Avipropionibacterium avicola TaxID=2840701 RepID=A0A9D1GZ90_9ACTN|nr:hypothetical protein [Candidatus Avipropionibacterium avicola]
MEVRPGVVVARSVGLIALVSGAVAVGFVLGMSRPRRRTLDHGAERALRE